MTPIFYGQVKDGILKLSDKVKFDNYLKSISGDIILTLKKKRKIRSVDQNSYYWVCVTIAGNELGYDPNELHDSFKMMFLCDRSKKIPLIRSTTKLTKEQFTLYLEKVIQKISELNIIIPTPKEYYESQGIEYTQFK